jgi:hypothetical protein
MLSVKNNRQIVLIDQKRQKRVKRRDLFRFESMDIQNLQWAIRTAGGSHLAVNDNGILTVKSGCPITTTFLRIVEKNHLEECFQGINCAMALCATQANTSGNLPSYIVSVPGYQTTTVSSKRHCVSLSAFTVARQSKNITVSAFQYFTFRNVLAHTSRVSKQLKRLCPALYSNSETGTAPKHFC